MIDHVERPTPDFVDEAETVPNQRGSEFLGGDDEGRLCTAAGSREHAEALHGESIAGTIRAQ